MSTTLRAALAFCLSFLLVGLVRTTVLAVTPSVQIAPRPIWIGVCKPYDQKPNARTIENGYYYPLIEKQTNVEKQAVYTHIIREIVSATGVQNASEISVSFDPSYQKIEFHDITIWRDNKPQNRLKVSAFKMLADESDFSRFIYNGTFDAKYILDDVRKGDRIEYAYTVTGNNPIFYDKFCRSIFLQDYVSCEHRYTTVLFSASHKLKTKSFNKAPSPVVTNEPGGLTRYVWEDYKVKAVEDNKFQPAWYDEFKRVQFTDYTSWAEVVDWALKINPVATDIKGGLLKEIEKLKGQSAGNKQVYFRNAVKFVQNEIRYMGIETGEYSHRANRPEKVFAQRYGDCKDKSLLLASMLQANGIEAQMALVNTDLKETIDTYLPSNTLFNHAIVVATIDDKQVWVDATINDQGGEGTNIYLPPYRRALVLKPGTDKLTVIEPGEAGKVDFNELFVVTNEKDPVSLTVKTIYTYGQADEIRSKLAATSITETEKTYREYYAKTYPKIETADSIKIIDDEKKNVVTTIEKYNIKNFLKRDSTTDKYAAEFYANAISEQIYNIGDDIKTPVALTYPYHIQYTLAVTLPHGWQVEDSHFSIDKDAYAFNKNISTDSNTLIHVYDLEYFKSYIPANGLTDFKADMKQILDHQLAFNFSYAPALGQSSGYKINVWAVLTALLTIGISIFIALKLYRDKTSSMRLEGYKYGRSIGGWLVLVSLGLLLTAVYDTYLLFTGNYFNAAIWHFYSGVQRFWYHGLLLFETATNAILVCYAIFCLVLMFNKRDILPKLIIGFYLFAIAMFLIDDVWAYCFNGSVSDTGINTLIRSIVAGVIWVSYFRVSVRVKETFIVPYPHNNIIYEQDETNYELE